MARKAADEVLDCEHGISLLWPCLCCQELAGQLEKEWRMQTSGTFPQLYKTDSVTKRPKPKAGKKR